MSLRKVKAAATVLCLGGSLGISATMHHQPCGSEFDPLARTNSHTVHRIGCTLADMFGGTRTHELLEQILAKLAKLEDMMSTQGQGLTDLQTQVAALQAALTAIAASIGTVITDLQAALAAAAASGDSDAAVETQSQAIQASVATLTTLTSNLNAAAAAATPAGVTAAVKKS